MKLYAHKKTNNVDYITTVYMCMEGPGVDVWKQGFYDTYWDDTNRTWRVAAAGTAAAANLTKDDLWRMLDERWTDPNIAHHGRQRLMELRMGNKSAIDYIAEFERAVADAGYTVADQHVLDCFEKSLPQWMTKSIYEQSSANAVPTTYAGWIALVKRLDANRTTYQGRHPDKNPGPVRPPNRPNFRPAFRPIPPAQARNPQGQWRAVPQATGGTLYTGQGQPMDLDRARSMNTCYVCRGTREAPRDGCQRTWHAAARTAPVRARFLDLWNRFDEAAPEQANQFVTQLEQLYGAAEAEAEPQQEEPYEQDSFHEAELESHQ